MTHRALEVLQAIHTAIPGSQLQPGWKQDATATLISMGTLDPEGDPSPNNFARLIWRLTVAVDLYVYELETDWLATMYAMLAQAHRAIMDDLNTYSGLDYVQCAWVGPVSEPEIATDTERTHSYMRAEFYVDFRTSTGDPEN